jgi:hypothetical protein
MSFANLAGTNPYDFSCPDGELITNVNLRVGSGLDQITSITCRPPNRISDNSYSGTQRIVNVGGTGGNPYPFNCPMGSGVSQIYITSDNDIVRTIKPVCVDLKTGQKTMEYTYGNNGAELWNKKNSSCGSNGYVTGMYGQNGRAVTKMDWRCGNFSDAKKGLFSDEGKVNCCMGMYSSGNCPIGFSPQSSQCDKFMINYCQTNTDDPRCSCILSEMTCPNKFDTNCIQKNGYRTNDMAKTPCPSVMNCTQFLSLSPGAQALATGVQQDCTSNVSTTTTTAPSQVISTIPTEYYYIIFLFILIIVLSIVYYRKNYMAKD